MEDVGWGNLWTQTKKGQLMDKDLSDDQVIDHINKILDY